MALRRMDPVDIVLAFNEAINSRDVAGLDARLSEDHVFTDSAGNRIVGRSAVIAAWTGFFESFPGYRNRFERVAVVDDRVIAIGRSECPNEPLLDGPALWTATVSDGRVTTWTVHDDTAASRQRLNIEGL